MDLLSEVLRSVKVTGGAFLNADLSAPWCIKPELELKDFKALSSISGHVICCHYVVEGRLLVETNSASPVELAAGEVVFLSRNDTHRLRSCAAPERELLPESITPSVSGGLLQVVRGAGGERTRIVSGFLGCDEEPNPLLSMLPSVFILRDIDDFCRGWIHSTLGYGARAMAGGDAGVAAILSRMAELFLVEAIRRYLHGLSDKQSGWLAGLTDKTIAKALALVHRQPKGGWTANKLARAVGLSRTAFANRFTALIGIPPIRYVTRLRLQVAARLLRRERISVAQAAFEVGYESEAAFTRAFKREFGSPPASWRRRAKAIVQQFATLLFAIFTLSDLVGIYAAPTSMML